MNAEYIKGEGIAGRMSQRIMAVVAEGSRGKVYLDPSMAHEVIAQQARPAWKPEGSFVEDARAFTPCIYGINKWSDLFTNRQLVSLTTFSDLVGEATRHARRDSLQAGLPEDATPLRDSGRGAAAYSEAIGVYLGFVCSRVADFNSSFCGWIPVVQATGHTFGRQAIPMNWDFAEINLLGDWLANYGAALEKVIHPIIDNFRPLQELSGHAFQSDAQTQSLCSGKLVSTDPPYYDNIGYADLSDFFYVWLRHSLRPVYPELFATLAVPKAEELVATPYRHGGKEKAEAFFLDGMTKAMHQLATQPHAGFPLTIYYAFKQSETKGAAGTASTGWETFLAAVLEAGLAITGTWPMRTELANRMRGMDSNALATSMVLVCQRRDPSAAILSRNSFRRELRQRLPQAIKELERANIAPVDVAQAAIGPGMAIFSQAKAVLNV